MKIKVNGKEKKIELENEKALLLRTLELLGYKPNTIVVEVNDLIINSFSSTTTVLGLYPSNSKVLESKAFSFSSSIFFSFPFTLIFM